MARTDSLPNFLSDVANAIKEKKGTNDIIQASNFDTEIANLPSGGGKYAPRFISFYGYTGSELDEELNNLDTSNITNMASMFASSKVRTISMINTSNVTNFSKMFQTNSNLTSLPQLDTSKGSDFSYMFSNCTSLKSIPLLNTSNGTNFNGMFSYCGITTLPQLDTSKGTILGYMFNSCRSLITIPELDASSAVELNAFITGATNLETFGGLKELGKAYLTTRTANYSYYKLDLSGCSKLTYDSLMNVINNLYDIKTAGVQTQQLVLGSTNLAKLTADEIAIAQEKGWTVS